MLGNSVPGTLNSSSSLCLETYSETFVLAEISPQFCGTTRIWSD